MPQSVKVMALTATATLSTQTSIFQSLNMKTPEVIYIPPIKKNVIYSVLEKPKNIVTFEE